MAHIARDHRIEQGSSSRKRYYSYSRSIWQGIQSFEDEMFPSRVWSHVLVFLGELHVTIVDFS
jgi:hypothetical protein